MQCFKCKQEIPDDSLRCPHCGIKVNMYCPECHTLNRFGSKYCSECGSELLKVCLKCGSNNLYYATNCRKCGASLNAFEKEHEEDLTIIEEPEIHEETKTTSSADQIIEEEPEVKPVKKKSLAEFMKEQAEKAEATIAQETEKIEFININPNNKEAENHIAEQKDEIHETEELTFIKRDTAPEKIENITPAASPDIQPITPAAPAVKKTPKKIQNCITTNGASIGNRNQIKNNKPPKKAGGGGGFFGFGRKKERPLDIIDKNIPVEEKIPEPAIEPQIQQEEVFVPENTIETFEQTIPAQEEEEATIQFINTDSDEEEEKKNLTFEDTVSFETEEIQTEEFSPVKPSDILELTEPVIPAPETPTLKFEPEEPKSEPIQVQKTAEIPASAEMDNYSFEEARQIVINAIINAPKKNLIAVSGDNGSGKTVLLKQVLTELSSNHSFLPFFARCSNTTQLSCLGAIQDAFLSLLGLPSCASNNINAFIKENKASLKQAFPGLSDKEITDFVNFLYPNKTDVFANIEANKTNLLNLITKAINALSQNIEHIVIGIDNFNYIDGTSYEFLMKILDNEIDNSKIQIIIAYQGNKSAEGYFASPNVNSATAKTIHLKTMTPEETSKLSQKYMNDVECLITKTLEQDIYTASKGSALFIEQFFALLYESGAITVEESLLYVHEDKIAKPISSSLEEIIKERLKLLMPQLKTALFTVALLGYRFDNQIFAECLNVTEENAITILTQLKNILYIEDLTSYSSIFRSYSVWEIIRKEAEQCSEYKEIIKKMMKTYSQVIVSSPMDIVKTFEKEIMPENLIVKLNEITGLICELGDTSLYTIAQKLKLKFIDKTNKEEYENLACEIYEELGMLNYRKAPQESISYLTNAIDRAQKLNNPIKAIDLCGYLVNSCYLTGNYYGVIETVDLVLKNTGDNITELEKALIKERKLKALYSIGNCEEIINLMTNEICVIIQDAILGGLKDAHLRGLATNAWVESNIILASAYAMQGNPLAFEVITDIKNFLPTINAQSPYFKTKTQLIEAFAFTSIGDLNNSKEILNDLTNDYDSWSTISELLSEWNLLNLVNKIMTNTPVSKEELFDLAALANNSNEYFAKNIIKLVLGYLIQRDGDSHKALEIYNEQITYFAKEKNAIGALLSWYFIAQATMVTEDASKALNIAKKALEVAQGPKINNYNFIIYLKKFIAEVYMSQGDLESSKMYLEQAMSLAQENGLFYALFKVMLSYAEYLEESLPKAATENDKSEIALDIVRVHKEAQEIAQKLNLENLKEDVNNAQAVFRTYCKLNNITPNSNLNSETII